MSKPVTERISDTEAVERMAEMLSRVRTEGVAYEITHAEAVVARVVPAKLGPVRLSDLDDILAQGPRLDASDAADFLDLVERARRAATLPEPLTWG